MEGTTAAALVGAAIGAVGGLAGGGLAALASLRASQVAARAPLAATLHALSACATKLHASQGSDAAFIQLETTWAAFSIQQRILCPSRRIEELATLFRAALLDDRIEADAKVELAGQTAEKMCRMVGAHSRHMLRWRALREESDVLGSWLVSEEGKMLSEELRRRLAQLL